ncbi:unnamed protein product [Rotaria sp. Silwood2]|nr:unnamed protein product [Rotaria sp. Silwood2]
MILDEKNKENNNHPLLKQIDKWEQESIKKIQQTANEARQQIEKLIGSQKGEYDGFHEFSFVNIVFLF